MLGLAREHRRAVVELVPAATRRTFTLREFAHLAASVDDGDLDDAASPLSDGSASSRLREAVVATASLRGVVEPFDSPDDADVIDPYRRSFDVYEASAAQLVPAVQATVALLARVAQRS